MACGTERGFSWFLEKRVARLPVSIMCLFLLFFSFGLGQGFSQVTGVASGKYPNRLNTASDVTWVSFLFNLDKNPSDGSGFIIVA